MKPKIFYILITACCLSLISSAKPNGKECNRRSCYKTETKAGKIKPSLVLPPSRLLMFDI